MQEAIGHANGTREIVRVMELSSLGETICSPRGEEDQMINVSRGMKDIKERRGEERALPGACQLTWSDPERELEGLEGASSVCL
jgi:hypothetical protein